VVPGQLPWLRHERGVLHTTEGTDWPGYAGGAVAPNATFKPNVRRKRLDVRQHFPVDRSSRALRNLAGGVDTNTLDVFQIELVGTCNPPHAKRWGNLVAGLDYIFWPDAPDWLLALVGERLAWLQTEHGIPATSPVKGRWTPYPRSYGAGGQRLTNAQWRNLKGWVGHQHVPENVHGDPGALDFPTIARHAAALLTPKPAAKKAAAKKAAPKPPTVKELLAMKLSDTITIPANYSSNTSNKPLKITVEDYLRRTYEWAYVAAYGQTKK
jgi:hypothetical protein